MDEHGHNSVNSSDAQADRSPLIALVRLCAHQAAREWLAAAHPHDPTQEAGDER